MGCCESAINDSNDELEDSRNKSQHVNEKKDSNIDELFVNLEYEELDDTSDQILNYKSVQRMLAILQLYEEWINNNNIHQTCAITEYLQTKIPTTKYNIIALLNDFQSIITLTNHKQQFEDIYSLLIKHITCNHTNCRSLSRNHRDRKLCKHDNQQRKNIYFGYYDTTEINLQQTLDKIHCYFLHSFDRFFKLRRKQLEQIQNEIHQTPNSDDESDEDEDKQEVDSTKTLFAIQKMYKDADITLNRTKFVSTDSLIAPPIVQNDEINDESHNMQAEDEKKDEDAAMLVYSFGYRYFYWNYYKDNIHKYDHREPINSANDIHHARFQDWYIAKKHESLKDELLNNCVCTISNEQWMNTYQNAQNLMKTEWCRTSVRANWNPYWEIDVAVRFEESGIENGGACQTQHLCAILLYTNYDFLQCKFTETYRKSDVTETDEALKERHSNFANWGRYLREMVEVFGHRLSGSYYDLQSEKWRPYADIGIKKIYKTFYHGINAEMLFVATIARLCGPTSTTIALNVAVNFTKDTGLCLTLKRYSYDSHLRYFDCSICSDFSNELEMLFIGGYEATKLKTIINTALAVDYKRYLRALNQLNFFLNGKAEKVRSNKEAFRRMTKKKDAVIVYKLITDEQIFESGITIGRYGYNMYHRETLKREIPQYIKTLFRFYCDNMDHVVIDLQATSNVHRQFSYIFCKGGNAANQYGPNNRNTFNIDLELICKLFKNIKWIEIKDTNPQNPMFTKDPNIFGSQMASDNRMVLKDVWLMELRAFFQSKVMTDEYNKDLRKISYNENAINQNGNIKISTVSQRRAHEFAIGDWRLQQTFGVHSNLVFVKNT